MTWHLVHIVNHYGCFELNSLLSLHHFVMMTVVSAGFRRCASLGPPSIMGCWSVSPRKEEQVSVFLVHPQTPLLAAFMCQTFTCTWPPLQNLFILELNKITLIVVDGVNGKKKL